MFGGALPCLDTKMWSRQLAVEPGVGQIPSNEDRHIHFQMSLRAPSVAMLLGSMGRGEQPEAQS